jgi:hypothetical protein
VKVEELGEEPCGGLFVVALGWINGNVGCKFFDQRLNAFLLFVDFFGCGAIHWQRAVDFVAGGDLGGALGFEPVAEGGGGEAVVAVVALHCGDVFVGDGFVPREFEAMLNVAHSGAGFIFVDGAFEAAEMLEFLQRVFFDAGAESLFKDGVEIDEEAGAEHAVDFFFARGVEAHEAFEGAGLVAAEVVDVHGGKFFAARHDEIDEPLESCFFFGRIFCPTFLILQMVNGARSRQGCASVRFASVSVNRCYRLVAEFSRLQGADSEEILQAGFADERIAFEIDEDVAG